MTACQGHLFGAVAAHMGKCAWQWSPSLWTSMVLALLLMGCRSCPQRRYAYVANDPTSEAMAVLMRQEVQNDLGLTLHQQNQLANLFSASPPGFVEHMRAARKEWRAAEDDKVGGLEARRQDLMTQMSETLWNMRLTGIKNTLSEAQFGRYLQISMQVYGPRVLLRFEDAAGELELDHQQQAAMKRVAQEWDEQLDPLRHALVSYALTGDTGCASACREGNASPEEVRTMMGRAETDRDLALLGLLSPQQRKAWQKRRGRPLRFSWDTASAYEIP